MLTKDQKLCCWGADFSAERIFLHNPEGGRRNCWHYVSASASATFTEADTFQRSRRAHLISFSAHCAAGSLPTAKVRLWMWTSVAVCLPYAVTQMSRLSWGSTLRPVIVEVVLMLMFLSFSLSEVRPSYLICSYSADPSHLEPSCEGDAWRNKSMLVFRITVLLWQDKMLHAKSNICQFLFLF